MAKPIDRSRARELNRLLKEHLDAFGALHGLTLEPYKLRFSDSSLQARIAFIQPNTSGGHQVQPKADLKQMREEDNYKMRARQFGLPPIGTVILVKGRQFKLTGLKTKKVSMTEVATGKLYKMDAMQAARAPKA